MRPPPSPAPAEVRRGLDLLAQILAVLQRLEALSAVGAAFADGPCTCELCMRERSPP